MRKTGINSCLLWPFVALGRLVAVKVPSFAGFTNVTFKFAVSAVDSCGKTA